MEQELVSRQGLAFEAIPAAGIHGVGWRSLPGNLLRLLQGTWQARRLIKDFNPDAMFFTGGFIGVPAALAGVSRPMVTFVPDLEPALAQRLISRLARRICVPVEAARQYQRQPAKVRVTGYPTRLAGYTRSKAEARTRLGLQADGRVLLVLGGSRGARSINDAVWATLERLLQLAEVVHVIGDRDWPIFEPRLASLSTNQRPRYHAFPYLHEEMADALQAADLVLSRAGASSLGEYPLFSLPSVLVPYPHAWRYQQVNAAYLQESGAAVVLADERLDEDLMELLSTLLLQPDRLQAMGQAAGGLAQPDAARRIADELIAAAGGLGAAS
jgi:UDP-N-acetylglucosamine--N-acetylmuramyl-(pentapeptide) pyrophosphoryl-undecaprenol N-acetylglucosamine transferase